MTKKCLIIAVAVLAAVVMTIPSIMFVQAKKDVIDISYSVTGVLSTISSGEVEINWTPDWRTRIARGTWRLYSYNREHQALLGWLVGVAVLAWKSLIR